MTKQDRTIRILTVALVACIILSAVIYTAGHTVKNDQSLVADANKFVKIEISSSLAYKSLEDLKIESLAIIYGKVAENSESFFIKPATGGDPRCYTDFHIDTIDVYRGDIIEGQQISVRIPGGIKDNYMTVDDGAAELKVGKEYVLFLY